MAGRPAGYSDEENFSDDYNCYNNDNFENFEDQDEIITESNNDPWAKLVFDSCNNTNIADQNIYDINSISSFQKCLEEGNVEALRNYWLKKKHILPSKGNCDENDKNQSYLNYSFNDLGGSRPIFIACRFGHPAVVKLLLELGASLEADKYDGLTPLMSICGAETCLSSDKNVADDLDSRLYECANLLITEGKVNINAKQNQQITALMLAAKRGHLQIVNLLIRNGVYLDATDSQRWTALCFSIDADHGHVARALLEAGADPDIATQEGIVAADLVNTAENSMLLDILVKFSKNRSKLFSPEFMQETNKHKEKEPLSASSLEYKKYSELDFVLLGIDAKEYLTNFEAHGVTLEHFLALNESDLENIGVDKVGVRKKMLTAISEIHKRNWEKTSLPIIKTIDKQKGIYYTCPDAVLMIANISDHFKYIRANVEHLRKNISSRPELLRIGQEMASLSDLSKKVNNSKSSIEATLKEIIRLHTELEKLKSDPQFKPVDLITDEAPKKYSSYSLVKIFAVSTLALGGIFIYKAYRASS